MTTTSKENPAMTAMNQEQVQQSNSQEQEPAPASSKAWFGVASGKQLDLAAARLSALHRGDDALDYRVASDGLSAVVVYGAVPCACAFRGASMKAAFRYRFKDTVARDKYVSEWLAGANEAIARKSAWRAERRAPHSLVVGDVLYSSWGWEQTNVSFYEIVAVRGAVVDLRKLQQDRTHAATGMQGTCTGKRGHYRGDVIKGKRPNGYNRVKISTCESASPWDGRPVCWSSYG